MACGGCSTRINTFGVDSEGVQALLSRPMGLAHRRRGSLAVVVPHSVANSTQLKRLCNSEKLCIAYGAVAPWRIPEIR